MNLPQSIIYDPHPAVWTWTLEVQVQVCQGAGSNLEVQVEVWPKTVKPGLTLTTASLVLTRSAHAQFKGDITKLLEDAFSIDRHFEIQLNSCWHIFKERLCTVIQQNAQNIFLSFQLSSYLKSMISVVIPNDWIGAFHIISTLLDLSTSDLALDYTVVRLATNQSILVATTLLKSFQKMATYFIFMTTQIVAKLFKKREFQLRQTSLENHPSFQMAILFWQHFIAFTRVAKLRIFLQKSFQHAGEWLLHHPDWQWSGQGRNISSCWN